MAKLADGSDSSLYEVGDTFIATESLGCVVEGDMLKLEGGYFNYPDKVVVSSSRSSAIGWSWLRMIPTEETKYQRLKQYKGKSIADCRAECICSFYQAVVQSGGDPKAFSLDMTVSDIVAVLAQNGIRFKYDKNDVAGG